MISAIILAVLYIGLINLLLIDSSRELKEAQRFRARVMAQTLAENGAELAAKRMISSTMRTAKHDDWMGTATGRFERVNTQEYTLTGKGVSSGVIQETSTVSIRGHCCMSSPTHITIDETTHSR